MNKLFPLFDVSKLKLLVKIRVQFLVGNLVRQGEMKPAYVSSYPFFIDGYFRKIAGNETVDASIAMQPGNWNDIQTHVELNNLLYWDWNGSRWAVFVQKGIGTQCEFAARKRGRWVYSAVTWV